MRVLRDYFVVIIGVFLTGIRLASRGFRAFKLLVGFCGLFTTRYESNFI